MTQEREKEKEEKGKRSRKEKEGMKVQAYFFILVQHGCTTK